MCSMYMYLKLHFNQKMYYETKNIDFSSTKNRGHFFLPVIGTFSKGLNLVNSSFVFVRALTLSFCLVENGDFCLMYRSATS
jgi:hypothetical protein